MKLENIVPASDPKDPVLLGLYMGLSRKNIDQLIMEAEHNIRFAQIDDSKRLDLLRIVREIQLNEEEQPRRDFYVFERLNSICYSGYSDEYAVFKRVGDLLYLEPSLERLTSADVRNLISKEGSNSDFSSPLINSSRFLNLNMRYHVKDENGGILDFLKYQGAVDINNVGDDHNGRYQPLTLVPNLCTL